MSDETLGELYGRLTPDQQERAFFLLFGIAEFYASGDTWFAIGIFPDPPAGRLMDDFRRCDDLDRHAPGGRARLALSWVLSMLGRARPTPHSQGER